MHNTYTLITGASEGFGKSLAFECAAKKMNLILVSLPGAELNYLAAYLKRNYEVDVVPIEKDLSKEEDCIALFEVVSALQLPVNMLINNAGIGSTVSFGEGSLQLYQRQIKLNVLATTMITHLFLDTLKKNKPSYILNVGSMSCFFFLVKKQVYGGTKSYIYFFSKSLHREVKAEGIHVSVICPGGMNTNVALTLLHKSMSRLPRLSIMNPEDVAPIAINGLLKGREVIIPGKLNQFLMLLDKLLPSSIKKMITTQQMKHLKSIALPIDIEAAISLQNTVHTAK
ncbi:MAG: SDR family NAD(P)-dependent oxidoreductase [Chitinophagaceae bacterium]